MSCCADPLPCQICNDLLADSVLLIDSVLEVNEQTITVQVAVFNTTCIQCRVGLRKGCST